MAISLNFKVHFRTVNKRPILAHLSHRVSNLKRGL